MNALFFILTLLNASLLAGGLLGLFLDIPARGELSNKERVQTALLRTISDRDTELFGTKNRITELEAENQLLPGKIEEAKNTLKTQIITLSTKKEQYEKASVALAVLQKQNAIKEGEIKKFLADASKNSSTTAENTSL